MALVLTLWYMSVIALCICKLVTVSASACSATSIACLQMSSARRASPDAAATCKKHKFIVGDSL